MNDVPGELQICAAGGGENKAAISAAAPVCRLSLYGEVGKRLCGKAAVRAATRPPPQRRSNPFTRTTSAAGRTPGRGLLFSRREPVVRRISETAGSATNGCQAEVILTSLIGRKQEKIW